MLPKAKQNNKYNHKHFSYYLLEKSDKSFYLFPTNKNKVKEIFSSLNLNKSVRPNHILMRICELFKDEISLHLADIYNNSFSTGSFPNVLKITKVIPIRKEDSKLDYTNYEPFSVLPNTNKIHERLMGNTLNLPTSVWLSPKELHQTCSDQSY